MIGFEAVREYYQSVSLLYAGSRTSENESLQIHFTHG